ncbi:MAG TPA: hypothetical protein VLG46_08465, partial [Anaerolineae bacterium]|nr:hypothetical protein [Anaerolineae bacterium]
MRHFPPSLLAVLLMSILAAGFMLMWVSRTSNARAASARPMTDAVVQPPCGEAAFDTAFNTVNNGGGILTFNCGTATIFFSNQKVVTANVTIDGGGVMTLSGGNSTRLFLVAASQTLTLTNLTLTDGNSGAAPGGGVMITDTGSLVADNVVFDHNTSNDQDGSAIFGQGNAAITLTNTLVQNNTTNSFGALYSSGPVRISG